MRSWTRSSFSTPLAADVGPNPEGAEQGCAAGRRVRFLRLSPPTYGLARRGWRRGAQLDAEFAFYASRRRLLAGPGDGGGGGALSWNESSLSAPLAADFGSGPEVATGGCAVNGEFAFYASCRRLRAWPGGGG